MTAFCKSATTSLVMPFTNSNTSTALPTTKFAALPKSPAPFEMMLPIGIGEHEQQDLRGRLARDLADLKAHLVERLFVELHDLVRRTGADFACLAGREVHEIVDEARELLDRAGRIANEILLGRIGIRAAIPIRRSPSCSNFI